METPASGHAVEDGHGLGRLHVPDDRDGNWPMETVVARRVALDHRYWWTSGWWGDQGPTPRCVDYAWTAWVEDGPTTHKPKGSSTDAVRYPDRGELHPALERPIYEDAQLVDQWPGESYDGTSVRAGAKVLQSRGLIAEYRWAWDAGTVVRALLDAGPVVVGTAWHASMFHPAADGLLDVDGPVVGGHAYLLDGVHVGRQIVRVKNSWGRGWGRNGFASLRIADLDRLLRDHGEACLAIERS